MDFPELEHHVLASFVEFQKITREISPMSDEACADDMARKIKGSCLSLLSEKRNQRDQLVEEGKNLIDEIVEKRELLSDVPGQNNHLRDECAKLLVAPYKLSISRLHEKIKEIDGIFNERSAQRNHLISEICSISVVIGRETPHFSDSLCDANLATLSETYQQLTNEKIRREKTRYALEVKFNGMRKFLGIKESPWFVEKLDDEALEEFRVYLDGLTGKYVSLKETFGKLSSKIRLLSTTLDLDCDVGDEEDGSAARLAFLETRLEELNHLKQEKLGEIIPRCICQLADLWTQLSLDVSKRQHFDSELHTSDNLESIESEISRMDALLIEPERARVLHKIEEYKQIRILEAELQEAQKDPGRLARRGFTQTLRNEEIKRERISQTKPGLVNDLILMIERWQDEHDGETFFLDNQLGEEDLLKSLMEEKTRTNTFTRTRNQRAAVKPRSAPQPRAQPARGPVHNIGHTRPQQRPPRPIPANSAAAAARLAATRAPRRDPPAQALRSVPRPALPRPHISRPVSARPVSTRPVSTRSVPSNPMPSRPVSSRPITPGIRSTAPRMPVVQSTAVHSQAPNIHAQRTSSSSMGKYSEIETELPTSLQFNSSTSQNVKSSHAAASSSMLSQQSSPGKQYANQRHRSCARSGSGNQPNVNQHTLAQSNAARRAHPTNYSGRVEKKRTNRPHNPGIPPEALRRFAFQDASQRVNIQNGNMVQPIVNDTGSTVPKPGSEVENVEIPVTAKMKSDTAANKQPTNWESWRVHQFEDNDMSYFGGGSVAAEEPSFNYERDAF